jgi:nucleoside 2-deoxyribosyltransferase
MKNRLDKSLVYLLGPMEFAEDNGVNWRVEASNFLKNLNIGILNPVDKPSTHGKEDEETRNYIRECKERASFHLKNNDRISADKYIQEVVKFAKDIVSIDLRLCDKADFGLMYVNTEIYSCGTWVEYAHLNIQRKPVVCFTNNKCITTMPLWMFGQTNYHLMHSNLHNALNYIKSIHEDDDIDRLNRWKFFDSKKIFSV